VRDAYSDFRALATAILWRIDPDIVKDGA
jgi:hypothetical protein